jgi:hypothetical protein
MVTREQYAEMFAAWRAVCSEVSAFGTPGHAAYEELVREQDLAMHAAGYRGKKPWRDVENLPDKYDAPLLAAKKRVEEKWIPIAEVLLDKQRAAKRALDDAADSILPLAGPEPRLVREYYSSTYRTTGSGEHYAKQSATLKMLECQAAGVRAELVRVPPLDEKGREKCDQWGRSYADYHVMAWVLDELDVDILSRRSMPLREAVRMCWTLGMNPRVMCPYLPHGYEEKVGIDFFGNDLRKTAEVTA